MPYWLSRVWRVLCPWMRVSDEINHAYQVPSISHPKKACRFPGSNIIQRLFVPLLFVCQYRAALLQSWRRRPRTRAPGAWKRSCRPVITRDTWRKEEQKRRWATLMTCQTIVFYHSTTRSGIWDAWHMLYARIVWIWARFAWISCLWILSVCQVPTQMLILHFNSNINWRKSWRCSVSCVMALSDSSINVITHISALILPVGCFKSRQLLWLWTHLNADHMQSKMCD